MDELLLDTCPLTLEDVYAVAVKGLPVALSEAASQKIRDSHAFLATKVSTGDAVYGVNTGFGFLSNVRIPREDLGTLQLNLVRSHACGMGPLLEDSAVRAMMLLRASNLAIGHSGVSLDLVEHILAVLNRGVIPSIPVQGSVGASGDLAPLAHLALVLVGEGRARVPRLQSEEMDGGLALKAVGLTPFELGPKEGLALINGTQFMTAVGALNLIEAERLCDTADAVGAMSVEALRCTVDPFDSQIHDIRPHPGQRLVAHHMRCLLSSQGKSEIAKNHEDCGKVQDAYSLRCIPQVHGASRDALSFVRQVLTTEINSVTDNPLVFPATEKVISGGNFHGQIIAIAMDLLAIAVAELASISEQRLQKLVNPVTSGLPAFLTPQGGLASGFMIVQVAAASIVSENKTLCHPASVDSIPTSADKEDHVSMGAWAARKAAQVVTNTGRVLCLELLAAAQGIDFLRPLRSSAAVEQIHAMVRTRVKKLEADRPFFPDYDPINELILSDELSTVLHATFARSATCAIWYP